MAALPLAPLALGATALGGAVSAIGTIAAGNSAKQAAYFRAGQEDQMAQESRAASQRQALEKRRQAGLVLSKIQAGAAAGGSDTTSPDLLNLVGDVAGRGEYQALSDMYSGENRARGLEDSATGERMTGDAAQTGSYFKAAGTLLSTGGSVYDRYNLYTKGVPYGRAGYG